MFRRNLFFILTTLLLHFPLEGISLVDNFQKAEKGDFVVAYINQGYTLLHIHSKTDSTLTIEEICVPSRYIKKGMDWVQWVKNGASNHTAWVMYEIEPSSGKVLEYYSFTANGWAENIGSENFLTTLLHLPIKMIPDYERKRIGPKPLGGDMDRRPLWHPPLFHQGKQIPGALFEAFRTYWPRDGSELSGKTVEVYLPKDPGAYPNYFPYWIEVRGSVVKAKLRVKDTGKGLESPKKELPRRPIVFLDQGHITHDQVVFNIRTPKHYKEFTVTASHATTAWKASKAITHKIQKGQKANTQQLIIPLKELFKEVSKGSYALFTVTPTKYPSAKAKTSTPLLLNP